MFSKTYLFSRNLLLVLLLLLFYQAKAQEPFQFERLDSSDGLSDNQAICIHQDKEGFMWFGTISGLNRYDGNSFNCFDEKNTEVQTITDQTVMNIDEDGFGHLWLEGFAGTFKMFDKKNHETKIFPNSFGYKPTDPNQKLFLHKDGFAVLAFKEFGIFVIDTKNNPGALLGKYLFDKNTLKDNNTILSVFAKDQNNIWISTYTGPLKLTINPVTTNYQYHYLVKAKGQRNSTKHYATDKSLYFTIAGSGLLEVDLISYAVKTTEAIAGISIKKARAFTMHNDLLWIATRDQGILALSKDGLRIQAHIKQIHGSPIENIRELYTDKKGNLWFYSTRHNEFVCYNSKSKKKNSYFFPTTQSNLLKNPSNVIKFFEEDSLGNIWIGTEEDGVFFYEYSTGKSQKISNDPQKNTSLVANSVLSFQEDHNNTVWIGTKFGISKRTLKPNDFNLLIHNPQAKNQFDNNTDGIYKDSYGNIWCGSQSGELYVYDSQLRLQQRFPDKQNKCGFNYARVFTFCEDSKGRLWIGTKGEGLYLLNLKKYANKLGNAQFTRFNQKNLHREFYDIIEDKEHRVWFASFGGGLHLLLEKNKKLSLVNYNKFLNPFCPFSINYGRCLLEDSKGHIWYGGLNGLIRFNVDNTQQLPKNVHYYSYDTQQNNNISYNDVTSVYEDHEGTVWIGTNGRGLDAIHPKTKTIKHYSKKNGLPSNMLIATVNDAKNNLWISTRKGLSKFNTKKKTFTNYSTDDGLPTNEFTETKPVFSTNKLLLGTTKGVVSFVPDKIDANISYPTILLTDFLIENKPVQVNRNGPLTQDINTIKSITLSHDLNSFTTIFSTTDFNTHAKNNLEYKLDGFDTDWIRTDKNTIVYTNIPSGKYTLKLRFSKRIEGTIAPEKTLTLIITSPLWKTWWAYALYIFCGVLLLYTVINAVTKIRVLRNNLKLKQELNDFKLQFFTNISHELRTPLTLIINPVKEVIRENKTLNNISKNHLNLAYNNANNLLRLVNQILDFRKLQINKTHLRVSKIELISFYKEVTNNFQFVAERKRIRFHRSEISSEHFYWFDPEKIEKIISNLLTNAFKFTAQEGSVDIQLITDNGSFTLIVKDSGQGMNQEQRKWLFNRHYKSESTHRTLFSQGAGIGLSIVEEFVKLHHGTIEVESQPEKGTVFTVWIPGQREGYANEDITEYNSWLVGSDAATASTQIKKQQLEEAAIPEQRSESTILLVEDNEELLSMLQQKLSQSYNIKTATNGQEGIDAVQKHQPDLVVTDLMMPVMNGIELSKSLKNNFDTCHIPVIMLTAKSSNEDKIEGYHSGADSYISKPFDFDLLIARIDNLQGQRKLLKQKFSNDMEFDTRAVAIEKQDQEFVDLVVSYVTKNMTDENFNLQAMYAALGFSKTAFYNKIKALTEMSPNQFVRTVRLKEAGNLFKSSTFSVSEVAYKIGYSDVNYFRTQFKKQYKMTPTEFIKGTNLTQ